MQEEPKQVFQASTPNLEQGEMGIQLYCWDVAVWSVLKIH